MRLVWMVWGEISGGLVLILMTHFVRLRTTHQSAGLMIIIASHDLGLWWGFVGNYLGPVRMPGLRRSVSMTPLRHLYHGELEVDNCRGKWIPTPIWQGNRV